MTGDLSARVMSRFEAAESEKLQMATIWDELSRYARPSRDQMVANRNVASKTLDRHTRLFDGSLMSAVKVSSAGYMAWLSPADTPWFQFDPPEEFIGWEPAESWLGRCTEIVLKLLARSNFYSQQHECYLDGNAFGIRAMAVEVSEGGRAPIHFQCLEPGSYSVLENAEGYVDTVFRVLKLTARQAVEKFGEDAVPEDVAKCYRDKPNSGEKEDYIQAVYPRRDAERDGAKMDGANKPIASVWLHRKAKQVIREGGFDEMPVMISRHLTWGGTVYGLAPAMDALADARQLNTLQEQLDVLAEVAANPRLLVPADLEGEVDLRAGGPTFFKSRDKMPQTWGTEGRYDIGLDRVRMRQEAIRDAFNLDAFQAFKELDKTMTATEVMERRKEKLDLFSPSFTLLTTEHFGPLLQRVFNVALREGLLPPPPQDMIQQVDEVTGFVPSPEVTYTSRIALALKAVNEGALDISLQRRTQVAQIVGPSAFDDLNLNAALREVDRNAGIPERWLREPEEIAAIQQQRAEREAQAQQMAMIEQAAGAVGKAGGVDQVTKALQGAA